MVRDWEKVGWKEVAVEMVETMVEVRQRETEKRLIRN